MAWVSYSVGWVGYGSMNWGHGQLWVTGVTALLVCELHGQFGVNSYSEEGATVTETSIENVRGYSKGPIKFNGFIVCSCVVHR